MFLYKEQLKKKRKQYLSLIIVMFSMWNFIYKYPNYYETVKFKKYL